MSALAHALLLSVPEISAAPAGTLVFS